MLTEDGSIPVFYYHSIADNNKHPWGFLSLPLAVFEKQMRYLSKNEFKTITITELYDIKKSGKRPPRKTVALTFDDGYLDNWVFAYPIMKKYGHKATIFVNPDFVDPVDEERYTLDDVWEGRIKYDKLTWWGYLSWRELRLMSQSGSVDIQSHGMTHTWHFHSDKIVDYQHPGDDHYWLEWNLRPDKKPYWLSGGLKMDISYGYPIYEFGRGFLVRRYKDDPKLAQCLTDYVRKRGGSDFFRTVGWRYKLDNIKQEYLNNHTLCDGRETRQEYLSRVKRELTESRLSIERQIKKPVKFICWPNGGYNEEVHRIAVEDSGYLATVTSVEHPSPSRYKNLLGRLSFGHGYRGAFRNFVHYMKFIFAVESRNGVGFRRYLIRRYQKTKTLAYRFNSMLRNAGGNE